MQGSAYLRSVDGSGKGCWLRFSEPVRIIVAHQVSEVRASIRVAEEHAKAGGWVVGFVAYEAAPAFDSALRVHPPQAGFPLAWFGLYDSATAVPELPVGPLLRLAWMRSIERETYFQRIRKIRCLIGAGETYQVNFTFRFESHFRGDPLALFGALFSAQPTEHAAFLDLGSFAIASASPELFFERSGTTITSKPMKGTAPRGQNQADDERIAAALAQDPKNRAENLMIVDMVRNDLGRIAKPGTVQVDSLYEVERYETLHQMVSQISAEADCPLDQVFGALFPSASITGAPKVHTMSIIQDLEGSPRGIYTGSIGLISPGGDCRFNVAIRTVLLNRATGIASYGIGSGIVWDSTPESEWDECLLKAQALLTLGNSHATDFALIETFAWVPEGGFVNLERHLARLQSSLAHFGIECERDAIETRLSQLGKNEPLRVRLQVNALGKVEITTTPLHSTPQPNKLSLGIAKTPVDSNQELLRHKTNRREVYIRAKGERPDCDDVILWNEKGEVTETTIANLLVQIDGAWFTPPVDCGLLPGIGRAILLEEGLIREKRIYLEDLKRATEFATVSSLRGWQPANLAEQP